MKQIYSETPIHKFIKGFVESEKGEVKESGGHNIWLGFFIASLIIVTVIAWDDTLRRGISDYYGEEQQNDASFVHAIVLSIFTLIALFTVIYFFRNIIACTSE